MARVKSKHGRGGKKVGAGKVSKSSHQNGEPMVVNQGEIKVKRKQYKKECEREGCKSLVRSRGLCGKHGGGPRCSEPDCDKAAQKGGKCSGHGGYSPEAYFMTRMPCYTEGCGNLEMKGGILLAVWRSVASTLRVGRWDVNPALQGGPGRSERELSRGRHSASSSGASTDSGEWIVQGGNVSSRR